MWGTPDLVRRVIPAYRVLAEVSLQATQKQRIVLFKGRGKSRTAALLVHGGVVDLRAGSQQCDVLKRTVGSQVSPSTCGFFCLGRFSSFHFWDGAWV